MSIDFDYFLDDKSTIEINVIYCCLQHGPGSMGGRSRSQQKDKQPRKVISVSLQQDVKLHTAENAWKPANKKENAEETEDETKTKVCIQ